MSSAKVQITYTIFVIFITLKKVTNHTSNEIDSGSASTEIHCNTNVRLHRINYNWNINRFASYTPTRKTNHYNYSYSIKSPIFSSSTNDKVKWYLKIENSDETDDKINLSLHLILENNVTEVRAKFYIWYMNREQKLVNTQDFDDTSFYAFNSDHDYWVITDTPINDLVLPDDKVKIICNITFCEPDKYTNKISYRNRIESNLYSECNLCQDFGSLLGNSEFSDVILVLSKNGKEYPAHKAVLAARSSVFAAMFKRRMEKNEKIEAIERIKIADMDEQVLHEMLRYIYTAKCGNIENIAYELLEAAHYFKLDRLEAICCDKIGNNLTLGNAIDTLVLADQHGFDELKSKTIRFIGANYKEISNTTDWKNIIQTNGKFVHEVCQKVSDLLG